MENKNSVVTIVGVVVVLVGAVGLGYGIRQIRHSQATLENQPVAAPSPKALVSESPVSDDALPEPEIVEAEPVVMVEESVVEELAEAKEEVAETVEEVADAKPEPEVERPMMGQGMGQWGQMFGDMNLTEAEQVRLREGFQMAIAKWQNMSDEDRLAERERMRGMRDQFMNMSDEDRQGAMQRMRDRFDQWRDSGDTELPPLGLD